MKLANYRAINYTYCHEALEIASNSKAFSKVKHFSIDKEWQQLLQEEDMWMKRQEKMASISYNFTIDEDREMSIESS